MKNEWNYTDKGLERSYTFKDFSEAIKFINKVAQVAEDLNHHPNIHLENYNKLRIVIFTHSDQKITSKDHQLASKINALVI